MSTTEDQRASILSELDWKSQAILQAVYDIGGTATTSEIKGDTGIDNDDIHYRYRRARVALEPQGLIEVNDSRSTTPQRNPPFEVTLTEQGERLAERLIDRNEGDSLSFEDRLEKIEATMNALEATVDEQCVDSETGEDSDVNARLTALEQRLDHLEEAVDGEYGAWSAEAQQRYQVFTNGSQAMRDFLLDEHGETFREFLTKQLTTNE